MTMPEQFVVWVEFDIRPGQLEAFMVLVRRNAATSLSTEPGCRRFDVLQPNDGSARVCLYEIYDSELAFKAHLATQNYLEFNEAATPLVLDKRVVTLTLAGAR
jgi:autoinducer 2-degrading protein